MRCCDPTYYLHIGQIKWEVVQNRKVGVRPTPPRHIVCLCVYERKLEKLHKLHTHVEGEGPGSLWSPQAVGRVECRWIEPMAWAPVWS